MSSATKAKINTGSKKEEATPRKGLGRGLAALLPTTPGGEGSPGIVSGNSLRMLPIERVKPNKTQPRKVFDEVGLEELTASIKARGVLQPIVVRRDGQNGYEIVAGERRWRASTRAGLHEIPAIVRDFTDSETLQIALIENLQRRDLDPLEEAEGYHRLIEEYKLTHEQVAEAVAKNRSTISNSLRILKLPKAVLGMLADGRLTAGHAKALMSLTDASAIAKLAEDIVARGLSVRDTEHRARLLLQSKKKDKAAAGGPAGKKSTPEELSVEERLQRALGTKVRLHHRKGRGHMEVFFNSFDELDGILDRISGY